MPPRSSSRGSPSGKGGRCCARGAKLLSCDSDAVCDSSCSCWGWGGYHAPLDRNAIRCLLRRRWLLQPGPGPQTHLPSFQRVQGEHTEDSGRGTWLREGCFLRWRAWSFPGGRDSNIQFLAPPNIQFLAPPLVCWAAASWAAVGHLIDELQSAAFAKDCFLELDLNEKAE